MTERRFLIGTGISGKTRCLTREIGWLAIISAILLGLLLMLVLPAQAVDSNEVTISGTINLPAGMTAPSGGLEVKVGETLVTIPANQTSAAYQYTVNKQWEPQVRISAEVFQDRGLNIIHQVFYHSSGNAVVYYTEATVVDTTAGNVSSKNITLQSGQRISGTVALPAGLNAPAGGFQVSIMAQHKASKLLASENAYIIPAGQNSWAYSLVVPSATDYVVSCNLYNFGDRNMNIVYGPYYYRSTGSDYFYDNADQVNASSDVNGINLTLQSGHSISWTGFLHPSTATPTTNGNLNLSIIDAANNQTLLTAYPSYQAGVRSSDRRLVLPPGSYKFGITGQSGQSYIVFGANGSFGYLTTAINAASVIDLTTQDINGGKFVLGPNNPANLPVDNEIRVSGYIKMPGNDTANYNRRLGLNATIIGSGLNTQVISSSIPEGMNYAPYNITVPYKDQWRCIRFGNYDAQADPYNKVITYFYLNPQNGYQAAQKDNQKDAGFAPELNGSFKADLELKKGIIASGTVSLPSGDTTSSNVDYVVASQDEAGNILSEAGFCFSPSTNTDSYSLVVPNGTTYKLAVHSWEDQSNYYPSWVYYSTQGSTKEASQATLMNQTDGDKNNINITLQSNVQVSSPSLTALVIKAGANPGNGNNLLANFSSTAFNYTLSVDNSINVVTVLPTASSGATAEIRFPDANTVVGNGEIQLATPGTYTVIVIVTQPGQTPVSYTLSIERQNSVPNTDHCFIATAAFGSKYDWPVKLLRQFRDQYLLSNQIGSAFVRFYYHNSPPLAAVIADSEPLKALVRFLLAPIIAVVYALYHPVIFIGLLGMIMILWGYQSVIRKKYQQA